MDGQTDRQTDNLGPTVASPRSALALRGKNPSHTNASKSVLLMGYFVIIIKFIIIIIIIIGYRTLHRITFLPRDASTERGYEIVFVCPSVRL